MTDNHKMQRSSIFPLKSTTFSDKYQMMQAVVDLNVDKGRQADKTHPQPNLQHRFPKKKTEAREQLTPLGWKQKWMHGKEQR